MNCTLYYSKSYALGGLAFLLAFATGVTWFMSHGHPPRFMVWIFAAFISIALSAILRSLVTIRWVIRVDESGIHDSRGGTPTVEWGDVIAVRRLPIKHRVGDETTHYLRDAWRPLEITVRNPDKYLRRFQKAVLASFSNLVPDPSRTVVTLNFMGLTPGSDVVESCIRQHLARLGRPLPPP